MTRHALAQVGSYAVIIAGLLVPAVSYAAGPYDSQGANPASNNCDTKTGCANYSSGNTTTTNPLQTSNSKSPYDQAGGNPASNNCDSKTGCANYSTGDQTKKPASPQPQQQQK